MDEINASEAVIRKIKKLLALSQSSNPNEAANAAAKARRLLIDHSLSMSDVGTDAGDIIEERGEAKSGVRKMHETFLHAAVAEANLCKSILVRGRCAYCYSFVGRKTNITAAEEMYRFLSAALVRAAALAGSGKGRKWINDYRYGWVSEVARRLMEMQKEEATPAERTLVLVEDGAVSEYLGKKGIKKYTEKNISRERDDGALARGRRDGNRVAIGKEIAQEWAP